MTGGRRGSGQSVFWGDLVGPNPMDPAKNEVKRSLLVEADGGLVAAMIAGANVHDTKRLKATLEAIVVERPEPTENAPRHLCLNKGYDNPTGWETTLDYEYQSDIRQIGEEKLDDRNRKRYPAHRWVV